MKLKVLKQIKLFSKLRAGALYYALFISFVVVALISMLILYTYIHNSYIDRQVIQEQVLANVKSGINLVCKNPELVAYNATEEISLFGNDYDLVQLNKKHWGVYDLIFAKSQRRSYKAEKIALLGDHLGKKEDIALYLSDKRKYLSISGNTLLKGSCYLPKLGIKRAYIEGQGYQNDKLVYGTIQQSNSELPALNPEKIKYLEELINKNISKQDSVIQLDASIARSKLFNSFNSKPLIIYSDQVARLSQLNAEGNIILKFDNEISIGADCDLKDVIIIAPTVFFEDGFSGQVQVIASESIQVGNSCKFEYPSFLGLLKSKDEVKGSITFGKSSILAGGMLLYVITTNEKTSLKLNIEELAKIYGTVYCNGFVQLKGSILGSLYCEGFTLKTTASLYENHLLNATVDYSKLPSDFIGVNLVGEPVNEKIIKWVE